MSSTQQANAEQAVMWNGLAGRGWVEAQEVLDRMLHPFEDLLVEAVAAGPRGQVLDVGCGTGSTTLAFARVLGAQGRAIGVDISEPMLAVAQKRAEQENTPASFIHADAQTHSFEPASFAMIVSRFGIMFFDDLIGAFANLRRAAQDKAELRFVAWRSAAENPFFTTAERAAAPFLPEMPTREPDAPGPFALADRSRVERILKESGWAGIDVQPMDVACTLPEKHLVEYFTWVGPIGRILQEADDRTRRQVIETVRPAFGPYVHGAEIRFTGACWLVAARVPSA